MIPLDRKYPPDFNQLLRVLRRETPDRPVLFEYFTNDKLNALLAGTPGFVPSTPEEVFGLAISAFHNAGFDHVTIPSRFFNGLKFEIARQEKKASVSQNRNAVITDRQSMDKYVWPDPVAGDYHFLDDFSYLLPEGMKFIVSAPGGVLENVTDIVGFERLCCMLFEDEDLIQEIFDAVGSRLLRFYEICASFESVGALIINDDWGFKTQTMLDPDSMRKYVFPWHRKMVAAAHQQGKPVILHSCGNIYSMLDEIIETIGYDAKHSFEDVILPVEQAWQEWSGKIAIMGGIDMNFLATSSPEAIRERARQLLELTGNRSYALGSGNSIPEFIPVENFLAMISVI
jgi:uroporphyrinogen decarboxylase